VPSNGKAEGSSFKSLRKWSGRHDSKIKSRTHRIGRPGRRRIIGYGCGITLRSRLEMKPDPVPADGPNRCDGIIEAVDGRIQP
jgi:hypothetical protein